MRGLWLADDPHNVAVHQAYRQTIVDIGELMIPPQNSRLRTPL